MPQSDETAPNTPSLGQGAAAGRPPGAPSRHTPSRCGIAQPRGGASDAATRDGAVMTGRLAEKRRHAAALTNWDAVEIEGRVHLVGVLAGGHERLPAGAWIVTSPVRTLDLVARTAITASTGRHYVLGRRLEEPLPGGAHDVIVRAMRIWRIDGAPPSEALTDAAIVRKLEASHLPERPAAPTDPSADAATDDDRPDRKRLS